ncbi:MAG: hypothetical protein O2856_10835 [Planctomycetota bacterium]|nr:hypothetical protein [Planctomycetota bacterium]
MAETVNSINVTASTPKSGQWKLVAGLVAVLILLFAFSGSEEEPDEHHEATSDTSASAGSDSAASSSASSASREVLWPEVPLEFLLTHNPFHPEVPEPEIAATDDDDVLFDTVDSNIPAPDATPVGIDTATAEEVASMGTNPSIPADQVATQKTSATPMPQSEMTVQLLFQSARGKAAMIDNKIYHEGDRVNGFEIASIAHDGVTLRLAETQLQPLSE